MEREEAGPRNAGAGASGAALWQFGQVFGERTPGDEVQEGERARNERPHRERCPRQPRALRGPGGGGRGWPQPPPELRSCGAARVVGRGKPTTLRRRVADGRTAAHNGGTGAVGRCFFRTHMRDAVGHSGPSVARVRAAPRAHARPPPSPAQRTSSLPWSSTSTAGSWPQAIVVGEWCFSSKWRAGQTRRGAAHVWRWRAAHAAISGRGARATRRRTPWSWAMRALLRTKTLQTTAARWCCCECAYAAGGVAANARESQLTCGARVRTVQRACLTPTCAATTCLLMQGARGGGASASGVEYRYLTEFQSHEPEVRRPRRRAARLRLRACVCAFVVWHSRMRAMAALLLGVFALLLTKQTRRPALLRVPAWRAV
jgi:hypothetical protein